MQSISAVLLIVPCLICLLSSHAAVLEGCKLDSDCKDYESCFPEEGQCGDLTINCMTSDYCGENITCSIKNHTVVCTKPACSSQNDCPGNKICVLSDCVDPCKNWVCGQHSSCVTTNHATSCQCDKDYVRVVAPDGTSECKGCNSHGDCPASKMCVSGECVDLCQSSTTVCGANSDCNIENNHLSCPCKPWHTRVNPSNVTSPCHLISAATNQTLLDQIFGVGTKLPDKPSNPGTTKKYIFSRADLYVPWYTARALCETLGLQLATVTSQSEQDMFEAAYKAKYGGTSTPTTWLGASDQATPDTYTWATLPPQPLTYTNWAPSHPYSRLGYSQARCVYTYVYVVNDNITKQNWYIESCLEYRLFACQLT